MHDNHFRNAFYKLILSNALCQSGKTDSERILRHPVRLVTSRTVRTRRPATSTRIRTRRRGATRASAWHPSASARRTEPRFQVENLYSPVRFNLVNSFPPILKYSVVHLCGKVVQIHVRTRHGTLLLKLKQVMKPLRLQLFRIMLF